MGVLIVKFLAGYKKPSLNFYLKKLRIGALTNRFAVWSRANPEIFLTGYTML